MQTKGTEVPAPSNLPEFTQPEAYTGEDGTTYTHKPEHVTALRGAVVVPKTHPLIVLRGRADSLDAAIGLAQVQLQKLGHTKLVEELTQVAAYVMQLLGCEVTGKAVQPLAVCGLQEEEIQQHSHFPLRYYGMNHFAPGYQYGEEVAYLNQLRTMVREVELCACAAFETQGSNAPARPDIIRGYNRLSSLLYVMMFRARAGEYPLPVE